MQTYLYLSDPVEPKRPADTKEFDFQKYIDAHTNQIGPTPINLVQMVQDQFYEANAAAGQANLDKIWEFVGPKVKENAGLMKFIVDNDGAKSKFFFPWLINAYRSPATALEISYGAGPDAAGIWHDDILETDFDDPMVPFILDCPSLVYNRERQLFLADLATSFQDYALANRTIAKIVDFGAGRLSWVRRHRFDIDSGCHQIYAFDKDPSIDPATLFPEELEELGIKYKHGDFTAQFNNPDCKEADLIILGGVASYIPPDVFAEKIIPAIYNLLKPMGVFFYDLQVDTPCYRHGIDILDWPQFALPDSVSKVIDYAENARRTLYQRGVKLSAEYNVDTYNKIPSAVMVTMQKLQKD